MGWIDTPTATTALRSLVNDGPADKLCQSKKLVGVQDGVNLTFKTFEFRRVGTFVGPIPVAFPQGVYKNGALLNARDIKVDDPASGVFMLRGTGTGTAPQPRDLFTATYYYQWFTDAELQSFLSNASNWLSLGSNYLTIPDGLNASALDFAARECYRKAAVKFTQRMSEVYKTEDAPEGVQDMIDTWRSLAKDFMASAEKMRDDFYSRAGQANQPLFGFGLGRVTDPVPRR